MAFPAYPQTPWKVLTCTHTYTYMCTHARRRQGQGCPPGVHCTQEPLGKSLWPSQHPVAGTHVCTHMCTRTPLQVPLQPSPGQQAAWCRAVAQPPLPARGRSPRPTSVLQTDFEKDVDLACRSGERLPGESDRWPSLGPLASFSFLCVSVHPSVCPHPTAACHSPRRKAGSHPGLMPRGPGPHLTGAFLWGLARPNLGLHSHASHPLP